MGWKIDIGIAATHKYAVGASGDVVEIVERPDAGIGLLLVDGQGSGLPARGIARMIAGDLVNHLRAGVRASAAAMAANDHLFQSRHGQVSASLDLLTIDAAGNCTIARFSTNQVLIAQAQTIRLLDGAGNPAGRQSLAVPEEIRMQLEPGMTIVLVTDGVSGAGNHSGAGGFDLCGRVAALDPGASASAAADHLLNEALLADNGRPRDDMTVVVLRATDAEADQRVQHRSWSTIWR